jgi:hypothetical protein
VDHGHLDDRADHHREGEPADMDEDCGAIGGDGIGDQGEDPERRRLHDDPDQLEQHGRGRLEQLGERPASLAGDQGRGAEQDGDEDQGEHVALGERVEDVGRDDPDQLLIGRRRRAERMRGRGAERRADAGADEGRDRHADRDGDRGGGGEEQDRPQAELAEPFRVSERADARSDRHEHDRRDQHADRAHEEVAEEQDGGRR